MGLLVVCVFVLPLLALIVSAYALLQVKRFTSRLAAVARLSGKDPVNG